MNAGIKALCIAIVAIAILVSGCVSDSPTPSTTPLPTTSAPTTTPAPTTSAPTTTPAPTTSAPTTTPPPFSEDYYMQEFREYIVDEGMTLGNSSISEISEGLPGRYLLSIYVTDATTNEEYYEEMETVLLSYAEIVEEGCVLDGIFLTVVTTGGQSHSCWYCREGWMSNYVSGKYDMQHVLDLCIANGSNM